MQKLIEGSLLREDVLTRGQLRRIAHLCAHSWGVPQKSIERFPCEGEIPQLARTVAIALSRELLFTRLERLDLHFGSDAEAIAAACNRVDERAERNGEFRTTLQFLRSACITALALDRVA